VGVVSMAVELEGVHKAILRVPYVVVLKNFKE
jgi:hypothetical protein